MACDLTAGRNVNCKDVVGGINAVYFVDFGDLGTVTLTSDEVTDVSGTFSAYKYLVKGANSLEQAVTSSQENGTTFFEQTLTLNLQKLTKEDMVQLKLMAYGRPHCVIEDNNGNFLLAGKEHGLSVSGGSISTGAAFGDMSGISSLTLTGSEKLPANFISGATQADPLGASIAGTCTVIAGTNS